MRKTVFIYTVTLLGFLTTQTSCQSVQQAKGGDEIPENIREYINLRVMNDILLYRLWVNPEFSKDDRLKSNYPPVYNTYNDKLFKSPLIDGERLIFDISVWPKDKPRRNYYLVTKTGNPFIRWITNANGQKERDTVLVEEYNKFNKYYPNDNSFLVYYDGKETYKRLSGNIIQDWYTPDWFSSKSPAQAAWFRMIQYNANHPYRITETSDEWLIFFEKCDFIKNDPGAFIIRMKKKWFYTVFDIIYYSNKKEITGDENSRNIYEIRYSRDYSNHVWPDSFMDKQPKMRKLSSEEIKQLNDLYGESIYKFGDIDYAIFNDEK